MLEEYELLIVGGGIIGVSCAYEASLRGVKVLLLEKSDFGSKTTQGSFKIVHGGLRYLQHLDLPRLRESVHCQNYLRRFAPHLIKTLPFIVPCYGYGMKGKEALSLACEVYNVLSIDRNKGVSGEQFLPKYKTLSVEDLLKIAPHVDRSGLRGGVVFFDSQMLDPDRLVLQFILEAQRNGAYFENYKEVTQIQPTNDGYAVVVKDHDSGKTREIQTKYLINAMGPWATSLSNMFGGIQPKKSSVNIYSKGIQIAVQNYPISNAISIQSKGIDTAATINRGGRAIFLQPWREFTLIGTTDTIFKGDPDKYSIEQSEIDSFFEEVVSSYPDPLLRKSKILFSFGGLRPIDQSLKNPILDGNDRDGMVNTSRDEDLIDHDQAYPDWGIGPLRNVVTIVGIKYTTCRSVAIRTLDLLSTKGLTSKNRGADYFNYGGVVNTNEELLDIQKSLILKNPNIEFSDITRDIWETYGIHSQEFLSRFDLSKETDILSLQNKLETEMVIHAIQNEHVKYIHDVCVRRLSRKLFKPNNGAFIERVINIFKNEMGRDQSEISAGIEEIKKNFPIELTK